jgi:hypothetical protein
MLRTFFVGLACGISLTLCTSLSTAGDCRVGVAKVDVTPDYPIRLNGFGFRRTESEGVRKQVWAKALAVQAADESPVMVIAIDTLCIPHWLREDVVEHCKDKVPADRIALTATHTHTAPMLRGVAPTIFSTPIPDEHLAHIERYSDDLKAKVLDVADAALADLKPARLAWAIGKVTFAMNRRTAGGPVDHDFPLLVAFDIKAQVRAVWANYACHCVTLAENQVGGDWAGYAQQSIERDYPAATALISIGCGADSNPSARDKVEIAEAQGLEVAREVKRLIDEKPKLLASKITSKLDRITLALAPLPTREDWEKRAKEQSPIGFHARAMLDKLDRGEKLLTEIDYPVQSWSFGNELAMVFLPGEVVVDYSKRLKSELDGRRLWINAYANDGPGYIPSERILREGGYEGGGAMVYYGIPGPYAAGLEDKIVAAVEKQLGDLFGAAKKE